MPNLKTLLLFVAIFSIFNFFMSCSNSKETKTQSLVPITQMPTIVSFIKSGQLASDNSNFYIANSVAESYYTMSDTLRFYIQAMADSLDGDFTKYVYICPCDSTLILFRDTTAFYASLIWPGRPRPRRVFRENIIVGNDGNDCTPDASALVAEFQTLLSSGNSSNNGNSLIVGVLSSGFDPSNASSILINNTESSNLNNNVDDDGNGLADDIYGYNFANSIMNGNNLINQDENSFDLQGEGSGINQIILNNSTNLKLLPIKIYDENNMSSPFRVACGIRYAASRGAKILCMSTVYYDSSATASLLKDVMTEYLSQDSSRSIFCSGGSDSLMIDAGNQEPIPSSYSYIGLPRIFELIAVDASTGIPLPRSNCRSSSTNNSIAIRGAFNNLECSGSDSVGQFGGSEYAAAKAVNFYINTYISGGPNYFRTNYVSNLSVIFCQQHVSPIQGYYKLIPTP